MAQALPPSQSTLPPEKRYALNFLLDQRERLLLLRRSSQATLGPGLWGLPAGKIEPGESAQAAAHREMDEEIGRGHRIETLRYLGPLRDTYYGGRFEIHLFLHRWFSGEVQLNDEHTAFAWVECGEYRQYAVMDGIDEDLALLDIWPREFLDAARIPEYLKR